MKRKMFSGFLALAVLVPITAKAVDVEFVNQSSWVITEIYFSPSKQRSWGADYLEKDVLGKGESLTLIDVDKGKWDVRVVDEDGDECILEDVTITASDRWVIDDEDLLACQAASAG